MKATIFDLKGAKKGEFDLPEQFDEPLREDVIARSVLSLQSKRRQPHGASPEAGMRASGALSKRRRKYRGAYGRGRSRVPRKILWRRGTQFMMVGAIAPGTVGGRRAHPPKAKKKLGEKINKKENRLALRSAIGASVDKDLVAKRGHKVPDIYPIIIEKSFDKLEKTTDVREALRNLHLNEELERCAVKKVKAGKGKARNRKYQKRIGPLFVVADRCKLSKSCKNLAGIDVVDVSSLNSELLAPGTVPGRLTLWSESAIQKMKEKKLFV